jgi:ABC-type Fe3+-siderophore transport system permease subunit
MLDEILKYHDKPTEGDFVASVMKRVRRQQRVRKLILSVTGLVGATFGAFGMLMLSDSLGRLITAANVLPASLALIGAAVFMAWLFQDELSAAG